jgi:large subunit ribosomal protein L15
MTTALHTLKRMSERKSMRVGRGSKRGKTSGRGTKGQSARAGNKKRPELRDIIKKLPKRRGYGKNRSHTVDGTILDTTALALSRVEKAFESGASITPKDLAEKGFVKIRGAKIPSIKIVGNGVVTKTLSFSGVKVSKSARDSIEKAGGSVDVSALPAKI